MSGTLKTKIKPSCSCGHNRWKTIGDRHNAMITEYKCRKCGHIRQITRAQALDDVHNNLK